MWALGLRLKHNIFYNKIINYYVNCNWICITGPCINRKLLDKTVIIFFFTILKTTLFVKNIVFQVQCRQ